MRLKISVILAVVLVAAVGTFTTASAKPLPAWRVTLTASTANVTVGAPLTLRGSVIPNARGTYVTIQAQQPGSSTWTTVATRKLSRHSTYSVTIHPSHPGLAHYRVIKPRGAHHRRGVSPVRAVTGWRWRSFESLLFDVPQNSGTTQVASVTLGGHTYSPGYVQTPQGDRFFHLGGQCSRLDVWVGGDPTSATNDPSAALLDRGVAGSETSYTQFANPLVTRDGVPVHLVFGPDVVTPIINLEMYFNGFTAGNMIDWGAPRVYCKF